MRRSLALVLGLLLLASCAQPEPEPVTVQDRIKAQAQDVGRALMTGDYETFVDLTYPRLIDFLGGRESMITALKKAVDDLEQQGMKLRSTEFTEVVGPVQAGEQLHAVVHMVVEIDVPEGILEKKSFLLAVSSDDGESWTFVDGSHLSRQQASIFFPEINLDLELPQREEPTLKPAPAD